MSKAIVSFLDKIKNCTNYSDAFLNELKEELSTITVFHDEISEYIFGIIDVSELMTFTTAAELVLGRLMESYKLDVSNSSYTVSSLKKRINNLTKSKGSQRNTANEQALIATSEYLETSIQNLASHSYYDKCKQLLDSIQIWATITQKISDISHQTESSINELNSLFKEHFEKLKSEIHDVTIIQIQEYRKELKDISNTQSIMLDKKLENFAEKVSTMERNATMLSITILGIFTGLSFLVSGGLNIANITLLNYTSLPDMMITWSLLVLGILSILLTFLSCISRLIEKKIFGENNHFYIFVYSTCILVLITGILLR